MNATDAIDYFQSEVPTGASGPWVIEKLTIADRPYDADSDPRPDCFKFRPGCYTVLRRAGEHFMTDFYDEWWTQREGIQQAVERGGDVLITGLGIGLVAEAMLKPRQSRVERITIVELSNDVITLVAPFLQSRYPGRIDIVEASAFTWVPPAGTHFRVAWHDIWPNPYAPEIQTDVARLEAHYRRFADWQGFWPKSYLDAAAGK